MTFTAVSKDILIYPGVGGYNLTASGNITKGQAVTYAADNAVKVSDDSSSRFLGIADSTVAHGDKVCIYGPGNIVYCKLSGSQSAGTKVGIISEGYVSNVADYSSQAIVVAGVTSTGDGIILILG